MTINISIPEAENNLLPQITVIGVGGSGGNAVNNMMHSNLEGVDFIIANTDAQALQISNCKRKIQLGLKSTKGLGAGMRPDIGCQAAEEALEELSEKLEGSHMLFIAAGMGGGTGTGAAPVIAKLAREKGILTVGVVTKPFDFEGTQRMKLAEKGISELQQYVDTLLVIPNQNLFKIANEKTTFSDAFKMADDVLYAGVRGVTDLMVQPGLINLDFSDVKTVMSEMGKAMMGTGEASSENRAIAAAEEAMASPLIDDVSLKGARGLIINITGGKDITLYEVDEAANRIKQEVDENANIIYGTTCDERLEGKIRVSIVATGIDASHNGISPNQIQSKTSISIDNSVYLKKSSESSINNSLDNAHLSVDKAENNENKIDNNFSNFENIKEKENIEELKNNESSFISNEVVDSADEENHSDISFQKSDIDEKFENLNSFSQDNSSKDQSFDNKFISENEDTLLNEKISEQDEPEKQVRKLSLFDTLDHENETHEISNNLENEKNLDKLEPFLNESEVTDMPNDEILGNTMENEFDSDPDENSSENALNQDPEDELLDIPTFLRRQAN